MSIVILNLWNELRTSSVKWKCTPSDTEIVTKGPSEAPPSPTRCATRKVVDSRGRALTTPDQEEDSQVELTSSRYGRAEDKAGAMASQVSLRYGRADDEAGAMVSQVSLRCRRPEDEAGALASQVSHRCMETTPSLACANKCVFCWRHHTNPVGKSWKWKMDGPLMIVEGALENHKKMIKQMKGVPGVKPERLEQGLAPKHCALSLVGEPIMYPEINQIVCELHKRRISTFLVTNAQFPERIAQLDPVTQLYVSVDAATKEQLKAIDRPLFSDFWERFRDSLRALRDKRQRTVYRLTLVKGWNMEEAQAYAELVELGRPDFIEIKGVTYCGSSSASSLTMGNVPWHADVKSFSEAICALRGDEYALACEHAHSCCVLLANRRKFLINGAWHTWINYDRFHDLVLRYGLVRM
ncbi:hypothetical protein CBR_g42175 [Chara braunii]|uniref:Radical SAM core domain-containing protein n=1 Tax=Chara braunii TaxID=69332 RepID=A0A388LXD5_CHABU|nr:hypothetical protein CBR_g42175 [Chara braunii]|eukprot:GBG86892.1 hypothetical protein CBR_g42175 [Chara braunii]